MLSDQNVIFGRVKANGNGLEVNHGNWHCAFDNFCNIQFKGQNDGIEFDWDYSMYYVYFVFIIQMPSRKET